MSPKIFVIFEPVTINKFPYNRDDIRIGDLRDVFIMSHLAMSFSSSLSLFITSSSSTGIHDVAMREIRHHIIIIHKDTMKKFDQLYRILRSSPYLGHQFHLRSWWNYYLAHIPIALWFEIVSSDCCFYISSVYPFIFVPLLFITIFPIATLSNDICCYWNHH